MTTNAPLKVISDAELDNQAQQLFIDFLNKCREVYGQKYTSEHDIDSEVSLNMHHMLHEYDKFRTNR